MTFLRAVDTLAGAVRAQANGSMNDYICKTLLAKKIEVRAARPGSPGREVAPPGGGRRSQASL